MSPTPESFSDRLRAGDRDAIEQLVEELHIAIYRFHLWRSPNGHVAEELTAETFYQVVRSIGRFRGRDEGVRAFVYQVARHVSAAQRRRRHLPSQSDVWPDDLSDGELAPPQQVIRDERDQRLMTAVAGLDSAVREIITLRYIEQLSIREIAGVTAMPEGTVKSHLHRGRRELKRQLTHREMIE